jgi:hypothetical protein
VCEATVLQVNFPLASTKLNSFLESMQGVGKQLDKARSTYDDALELLCTGKGNLFAQAAHQTVMNAGEMITSNVVF